jgi:hypothetical protein
MNFSDTCEFNTIDILVRIVVWNDANTQKRSSLSIHNNAKKLPKLAGFSYKDKINKFKHVEKSS